MKKQELNNSSHHALQQTDVSRSLPTDEDISKKAQEARVDDINDSINRVGGFIVGATWMRDLLKGNGKYSDKYVSWLEEQILALRKTDVRRNSCDKACSPSDFYKGGKCDKNGCYY